jgi:hypothetical protein
MSSELEPLPPPPREIENMMWVSPDAVEWVRDFAVEQPPPVPTFRESVCLLRPFDIVLIALLQQQKMLFSREADKIILTTARTFGVDVSLWPTKLLSDLDVYSCDDIKTRLSALLKQMARRKKRPRAH